jgi:hypothetical protein
MPKPKVGDQAPEFQLPGTGERTYSLADYDGRKVVLAFYPADFTDVNNYRLKEGDLDADVLGISPYSIESQERFAEEKQADRATARRRVQGGSSRLRRPFRADGAAGDLPDRREGRDPPPQADAGRVSRR